MTVTCIMAGCDKVAVVRSSYCEEHLNDNLCLAVEREVIDLPSLGKICGAIGIIAIAGVVMLMPLALVLYLISWWAVCPK